MAKVRNPLLSLAASGPLGDTLGFLRSRGSAVVRSIAKVRAAARQGIKRPASAAQEPVRTRWLAGCADWNALSVQDRAGYVAAAAPLGLTGFNLFMRDYIYTPPPSWIDGSFGPLAFTGAANTLLDSYDANFIAWASNTGNAVLNGSGALIDQYFNGPIYSYQCTPGSPNYKVRCLSLDNGTGNYSSGLGLRTDPEAETGYYFFHMPASVGYRLYRADGATAVNLGSSNAITPNGNRTIEIEAFDDTITVRVDGTDLISVTDSTYQAAGLPAVVPLGGTTASRTDNFQMIDTPPP